MVPIKAPYTAINTKRASKDNIILRDITSVRMLTIYTNNGMANIAVVFVNVATTSTNDEKMTIKTSNRPKNDEPMNRDNSTKVTIGSSRMANLE